MCIFRQCLYFLRSRLDWLACGLVALCLSLLLAVAAVCNAVHSNPRVDLSMRVWTEAPMLVNVFYGQDKRCEHCTTVRVNPGDKQLRLALPVENLRHLGFCFGDAGKFTFGGVEVQGEMRLHLPANAFLDYRGMKKVEYGDDDEVTVWPTKDNPHIHYGELFDIPCRGCGFRFLGFLPVVGMLLGFVALVLLGLCHFSRLAVGYQVTLLLLVSLRVLFTCSLPMLNFGSCWDDGWAMKCAQSFCNG